MTAPVIRGRWTLWPCAHRGVEVEPSGTPPGYRCAECGASPVEVVPVPDGRAVERAAEAILPSYGQGDSGRAHRIVDAVLAAAFEARP